MNILGVETTAHTFGVGIITSEGEILANAKDSYASKDIGMIPDQIVDHHKEVAEMVLKKAFEEANLGWDKVDLITYSAGPGLDPVLWAGYHITKRWASKYGKKMVGVNHCCAHLSIGKLWNQKLNEDLISGSENKSSSVSRNKLQNLCYLYVSGVNTQIIVEEKGKYRVMGETLDIGLGNMLDKFGRIIGLGFPAGPEIEILAKNGKYIELPYTVKGMDVSFSGILTKAQQLWEKKPTWRELFKKQGKTVKVPYMNKDEEEVKIIERLHKKLDKPISKEDLCFSIQETSFAMLAEVVERAMAHTGKKELLLIGGVGANQRFCEMLDIMCKERGAKFYKVPMDLAGDQGVMIAWEGFLRKETHGDIEVNAHWRADEV
jgi:glycoprotease/Kae1 family metallohydrolase